MTSTVLYTMVLRDEVQSFGEVQYLESIQNIKGGGMGSGMNLVKIEIQYVIQSSV